VALNSGLGTFELKPDTRQWAKEVALRSGARQEENELTLCAERLLPEALAEVSRENALAGGPSRPDLALQGQNADRSVSGARNPQDAPLFSRLRDAVNDPAKMAELEAEMLRRGWGQSAENFADNVGGKIRRMSAKKSAEELSSAPKAQLSSSQKAELSFKGDAVSADFSADDAWRWLESLDRKQTLIRFGEDYRAMCQSDPKYVLTKLRRGFEEHVQFYRSPGRHSKGPEYLPRDPVGWIGGRAREEGKMHWRGRVR